MDEPAEEVMDQLGDVTIIVRPLADPAAVALLKRTVYGTKGVRYQHTGQEAKINRIHTITRCSFTCTGRENSLVCIASANERYRC